jgi:hypothetical protein
LTLPQPAAARVRQTDLRRPAAYYVRNRRAPAPSGEPATRAPAAAPGAEVVPEGRRRAGGCPDRAPVAVAVPGAGRHRARRWLACPIVVDRPGQPRGGRWLPTPNFLRMGQEAHRCARTSAGGRLQGSARV